MISAFCHLLLRDIYRALLIMGKKFRLNDWPILFLFSSNATHFMICTCFLEWCYGILHEVLYIYIYIYIYILIWFSKLVSTNSLKLWVYKESIILFYLFFFFLLEVVGNLCVWRPIFFFFYTNHLHNHYSLLS
jgi:hypothetical protein